MDNWVMVDDDEDEVVNVKLDEANLNEDRRNKARRRGAKAQYYEDCLEILKKYNIDTPENRKNCPKRRKSITGGKKMKKSTRRRKNKRKSSTRKRKM